MTRTLSRIIVMLVLSTAFLILAGCVSTEPEPPQDSSKEYSVKLYFANDAYVQTGNEELDQLVEVSSVITAEDENRYFELVNTGLRTIPEGTEGATTLIDDKIAVSSVSVEGGTATVDLQSGAMNSGSMTEAYVISQIVESLLGSFEEIDQVQFLVDGEVVESLMGHFDVSQPFTEGIYKLR